MGKFFKIIFLILLGLGVLSQSGVGQARKKPSKTKKSAVKKKATLPEHVAVRTKIAEGKYEMRRKDEGSAKSWQEPWTLYKTRTGYELEERWEAYREGNSSSVIIDVLLIFAPGLYPIQARIGSDLSANQLNCSMTMKEFKCSAGGKENSIAMTGPYNFFLPSPWLLSSIGRRAPKVPDQSVALKLVQMSGMGESGPRLSTLDAKVAYVGNDQVEVEGSKLSADIYEIRGVNVPPILIWLSTDGVVLMMQDASKPDQRMELVEFKKLAAF